MRPKSPTSIALSALALWFASNMMRTKTTWGLSGNALKLLAAVLMVIDHVGVIFFPMNMTWRYIGRLSMPIFAFLLAQGCKYTHNRWRYLLNLSACLIVCQVGNYIGTGEHYICILGTFLAGALVLFALQDLKKALLEGKYPIAAAILLYMGLLLYGIRLLNSIMEIDYGFWGCMLPVFVGLPFMPQGSSAALKKIDSKWVSLACFGVGLVILSIDAQFDIQGYSLLALPLLALYSGRRGTRKLKYFFYLFYPIHLALLQGLYMIL